MHRKQCTHVIQCYSLKFYVIDIDVHCSLSTLLTISELCEAIDDANLTFPTVPIKSIQKVAFILKQL